MLGLFKKNTLSLNMDAWSDGQVASKLWLCDELERTIKEQNLVVSTVWIFGSWYGTLPYMLHIRQNLCPKKIVCFDLDKRANQVAKKMLDHWCVQANKIEIQTEDCTTIGPRSEYHKRAKPDLVINTSCEHMNNSWWDAVPIDCYFAIQSTNMDHPTHVNKSDSLAKFNGQFCPHKISFIGEKNFTYPTLQFDRFMLIGKKLKNEIPP